MLSRDAEVDPGSPMLLASLEGDPWWVELELNWKSKGIDYAFGLLCYVAKLK